MAGESKPHSHRHEIIVEDIETEGDRQLKVLLKRQLDTQFTLDDHLSRKKVFTEAAIYKPLGEEVSGTSNLSDFQKNRERSQRLEELRQYGLSEEEIKFKLQAESHDNVPRSLSRYGQDPVAYAAALNEINRKIAARQNSRLRPDTFSGAKSMSRHEMDVEKSITHDKEKAKLLGSLVVEQPGSDPTYNDKRHPINHLDEILNEAITARRKENTKKFENLEVATCAPKPSNWTSADSYTSTDCDHNIKSSGENIENADELRCNDKSSDEGFSTNTHSLCNDQTIQITNLVNSSNTNRHNSLEGDLNAIDSKNRSKERTLQLAEDSYDPDRPRKLLGHVEPIPKDVIVKYRIPLEDIKKLERFQNYEPGIPSKTLYLKNLSLKVTEADLVSLFIHHQKSGDPQLVFRLMSGRMKGQAFVTFPSVDVAKEALELVNGYPLKGKPVIILYGKQTS